MKGDPTLWLPGTDHASIATEVKIVEAMRKEGLDQAGRGPRGVPAPRVGMEERVRRTHCSSDPPSMGNSCDWSRERFTMDEGCSKAVHGGFQQPV